MTREWTIVLQGGMKVCTPATLASVTAFVLLEQETWFEDEFAFTRACVAEGDDAVDVGANCGVYAAALARHARRVIAVEPATASAALLRNTVRANGRDNVEVVQAALSDRRGEAELALEDRSELNALVEPGAGRRTERVTVRTLDDLVDEHTLGNFAFLKIDAEGHELAVGRGGHRALRRSEPLVLAEIRRGEDFSFDLLVDLAALGFGAYRLVPGLGFLVPHVIGESLDEAQLNLFACTPGRALALERAGLLVRRKLPQAPAMELDADAREYLQALPGAGAIPGGAYGSALTSIATLQTAALDPVEELGLLERAHRDAEQAYAEQRSFARGLTLARLCADTGRRSKSVRVLAQLINGLSERRVTLDEPCVPPTPRYATLDARSAPREWVECATAESTVRLSAFSSFFQGDADLPMLDFLRRKVYYGADMERRRQLLRMRNGQQARVEPHPLLTQGGLNTWFWSGSP